MFSRAVSVDEVASHEGRVEATPGECAEIASICQIKRLSDFSFTYRLQPLSQGRYLLSGNVCANVTQACVITLEPVDERIDETVSVELWPEDQIPDDEDTERSVDNLSTAPCDDDTSTAKLPEIPEPIIRGKIDLGLFAADVLASALNPYPRKEGAVFSWSDPTDTPEKTGPFAALTKLRDDSEGGNE
ncbi:MAG: YceD family protein [Alphaproteobacteria bacterium]